MKKLYSPVFILAVLTAQSKRKKFPSQNSSRLVGMNYALFSLLTFFFFLLPTANCFSQMATNTFSFTGSQQTFIVPSYVNSIFVDGEERRQ